MPCKVLTPRQAAYVEAKANDPLISMSEGMRRAGYPKNAVTRSDTRNPLKTAKVMDALREKLAKEKFIKTEVTKYKADGRGYLTEKFVEHAHAPLVTPNQTHALELLGKLDGLFVDRLEIDIGEKTRQAAATKFITSNLLPQPSQDN